MILPGRGGALFDPDGRVTLKNCILWSKKRSMTQGDTPDQISTGSGGTSLATFSNVEGGWAGSNNLNADPLFSDSTQGNFRLTASSPCKNRGDPSDTTGVAFDTVDLDWDSNTNEPIAKDLGLLPRVRLGRVDMGAYELFSDTPPGGGGGEP